MKTGLTNANLVSANSLVIALLFSPFAIEKLCKLKKKLKLLLLFKTEAVLFPTLVLLYSPESDQKRQSDTDMQLLNHSRNTRTKQTPKQNKQIVNTYHLTKINLI